MRIIATGVSGFIGERFLEYNNLKFICHPISLRTNPIHEIKFDEIQSVVHFAGLAHQMLETDASLYFEVNYELTKELAVAAKNAKVPHFVFISTIKVYGETWSAPLKEETTCNPVNDPYGESKLKAELFLQSLEDENFKVAIIRPPLVYGPGVKGNLARLLQLADTWYPLPFGGIEAKRTMVFLDNLIELINCVIDKKASGIFLAGDAEPITTSFLIAEIRKNLGRHSNLFRLPAIAKALLNGLKPELAKRLFGSLELDTSLTNSSLGFTPPYSSAHGFKQMTDWYKSQKQNASKF